MALDNVIPIDADTARLLARRRVHFRWFVACLTAAYVGVLVPTLLLTPLPPIGPFVMLAVLVILAEHRFVLFGDETSMSASIIVVVASVFVFADSSPLAGPLLIGSLGGLYLPHLRRGTRTLMIANASAFGISGALAAAIASGGMPGPVLGPCATVAAYWYANSVLIGCASASRQGLRLGSSVRTQATSEWPLVILATATVISVSSLAPETLPELLAVAVALIAFEIRLHNQRRETEPLSDGPWRAATIIGFAAAAAQAGALGWGLALLAIFLVLSSGTRSSVSRMSCAMSVCTAFATAAATNHLGIGLALAFVLAILAALVTATGLRTVLEARRLRVHLPPLVFVGLLVPNLSEATAVGVTAVLVSLLSRNLEGGLPPLLIAAVALALAAVQANDRASATVRVRLSRRRSSQGASR